MQKPSTPETKRVQELRDIITKCLWEIWQKDDAFLISIQRGLYPMSKDLTAEQCAAIRARWDPDWVPFVVLPSGILETELQRETL